MLIKYKTTFESDCCIISSILSHSLSFSISSFRCHPRIKREKYRVSFSVMHGNVIQLNWKILFYEFYFRYPKIRCPNNNLFINWGKSRNVLIHCFHSLNNLCVDWVYLFGKISIINSSMVSISTWNNSQWNLILILTTSFTQQWKIP